MSRVLTLLLSCVAPLAAQDQFGAAVAIAGNDVVVVKPSLGRGPAAVLVYRAEGDTWRLAQRLVTPASASRGQALSPSVAASADRLLVGGGDPDGRVGAHAWVRQGDHWIAEPDVPFGDGIRAAGPAGPVTLQTVMRILLPPPRVVARHDGVVLVASGRAVRGPFGTLAPDTTPTPVSFGAALALDGDHAVVGAPLHGSAYLFALEGDTARPAGMLTHDLSLRNRFGAAIAIERGTVAVGAPRAGGGVVIVYERADAGFVERARLAGDSAAVAGFGSALALAGDELVVGAPGTGRLIRYARVGGTWRHRQTLTLPDAEGSALGASVALEDDLLVAGAPGADGSRGRVAVFRRGGTGDFGPGVWIPLGGAMASHTGREIPCEDGTAHGFRCDNVDLQAFLSIADLGGAPSERVSDIWGWTDPETRREYALVGRTGGLVFVDVTDPSGPRVLGEMPANPSGARDIKVYRDHAFMTGDGAGQHGLMVFDLTRLREADGERRVFAPDTVYRGIASAHNLAIDTAGGYAVPMAASGGGETCGGGLHFVDIRMPRAPVFAGCYTDTEGVIAAGRTHDAQCVAYHGPDAEHRGKHVCFASNESALRIVDVSDRANPIPLAAGRYPGAAYIHQGWLTPDQRYFYLDDELDELVGTTDRTRTMIWDVSDLDDPVMVGAYLGPDNATDHNLFIVGARMYQANYQAGLRVVDITDPERPVEVGYFDTTPYEGNPAGFNGAWTAYPFFASGNVIVSSMGEGLFVLRPAAPPILP